MTKHKEKSFLSNAAMYGIGSVLLQAASIVLLPLYLNYLTPEEYGVLEILNQVGTIVVIGLMANGLRMATLTFHQQADRQSEKKTVISTIILLATGAIVVGCFLAFAVAPWLSRWLGLTSSHLLACGVITVLLEALVIVPMALMQARIQSVQYVTVSFAMFLVRVGLTIYFLGVCGLGVWGILLARSVVAVLFGAVLNWREFLVARVQLSWKTAQEVLCFVVPFLPGGVLAFFINSGDRFYLMKFAGEYEVGIYSLAYRMATAVSMFAFIPLYKVWSAKMYGAATKPDAPRVFGNVFTYLIASLIAVGLGVSIFAGEILRLFGAASYVPAIQLVPVLIVATVLMSAANLMDSGLYVTRKTKFKPLVFAVTAVVILAAYSLLIPAYGGAGAAWATLIGFTAHLGLTWAISQKVFYVEYEYLRVGVLALSAVACWWVYLEMAESQYLSVVRCLSCASWLLVAYCAATKAEREKIYALFRQSFRRRGNSGHGVTTQTQSE